MYMKDVDFIDWFNWLINPSVLLGSSSKVLRRRGQVNSDPCDLLRVTLGVRLGRGMPLGAVPSTLDPWRG